ncbi:MAG: hypothetical protein HRT87_02480 [Legionellales bacterium]|nr:hypothetical protein [Legionellales bacterium]
MNSRIFPSFKGKPYYIYAQPYVRTSAGIKVLYILCHHLNLKGYEAYIIQNTATPYPSPSLYTPILSNEIYNLHKKNKLSPIVIYSETIPGNPMDMTNIVRYFLNYPALLGGNKSAHQSEMNFAYSKFLAENISIPENQVLFVPACDLTIFKPPSIRTIRKGSCFYAGKYKYFHGGKLFDVTKTSKEITRSNINEPTPAEIAKLFQHSELFYCYEDSALAIEAVLCGCPTVFLPNKYFNKDKPIAHYEIGQDGFAYQNENKLIQRAKDTVSMGIKNYLKSEEMFFSQLDNFINITQSLNGKTRIIPYHKIKKKISLFSRINAIFSYYKIHGLRKLIIKFYIVARRNFF